MDITFNIPIEILEEYDDEALIDLLTEDSNFRYLQKAFDFSSAPERSEINNVSIENLTLHDEGVTIEYYYDWDLYAPCKDLRADDRVYESVDGVFRGNTLVFKEHIPPEPRSPHDEF